MKRARILIFSGVLLVGSAAAVTGTTVIQTQKAVQAQLDALNDQLQAYGGRATVTSAHHTLLGGDQTTTLTFKDTPEATITLHSTYRNGPWLPGGQFGASLATTDVTFSKAVQAVVDRATHGQPVRLQTLVHFGGRNTTTVNIPAGDLEDGGTRLTWTPLVATLESSGDRVQTSSSPLDLQWTADGASGHITGVRHQGDSRLRSDGLTLGDSTLSVDRVDVTAQGETATARGLRGTFRSALEGATVKASVGYTLDALSVPQLPDVRNVKLIWSLGHLDPSAMKTLTQLLQKVNDKTTLEAQPEALLEPAAQLLHAGPVLSLDELSLDAGGGHVGLHASLSFDDPTTIDLRHLDQDPMALLGHLRLNGRFDADEVALRTLGNATGQDIVAVLKDGDLVTQAGGKLSSVLTFNQQGLLVNGRLVPGTNLNAAMQ
ncbi:DUF945 family protein [Deinococcus sonorensis]|uniref:DUF945 family protein n=2 Tax=Deinococcus sonorensis TaxID=309891 RepID=A0AAU7UEX6_9DEIO